MGTSSEACKKRTRFRRWFLLVLALALLWLAVEAVSFVNTPASLEPEDVVVVVPGGTSLSALADRLHRQGLVRSAAKFRWLVWLRGAARQIKAGEYKLSTGLRPGELLDKLVRGEVLLHQITFPEGCTIEQMAALLDSRGLAEEEEFLAVSTEPDFVHGLGIPAATVEGYLFPDTYRFARGLSVEAIARSMVARFEDHFQAREQKRAEELGLTRHQVVILASVVEKETAVPEERSLIAGVFFNRLRRRMPLQSDPTVIYGLEHFDGNLTREHLQTNTPYNTYTRRGLPAGPICNPGAESIQAVLNPASTLYLYFVAKKDGTHHFSTTLKEHNAAVSRHQKKR